MDVNQLLYIIKQGEGIRTEFKEAADSVPSSFYETVVSFSNSDGGTILLGVDDNGDVKGINPAATVKLNKDIITALNTRDCINPPVYVQPFTIQHPNGLVMLVQIPASSQLHDHKGIIYSREFEVDIDVTRNQQKVSDIYLRKRNFFTEAQILPHLKISDLDNSLFEKARQIISNNRSDHPWLVVSEEQMLRDSTLWRKDFQTGEEGFTLAAALIFGTNTTIQSILPAYKVEAMVRIVNKDRWDDRINPPLRTNLIDTYLLLKEFINKHLPDRFYTEADQRIDLRDKIFREVIGNIIVHREYTSALSTELIIYENEVTITNPNKPLFHGIIDPIGFNPYPKNPNIRKFFTSFGWTDEIGSGIRNTNKYLPLYANGAKPVFLENDLFTTKIPLQFITLAKYTDQWISWLELEGDYAGHLTEGLQDLALPTSLAKASWEELLLHLVPSWHENGTQLATLKWPDNQYFEKELGLFGTRLSKSKVPTLPVKGANRENYKSADYQELVLKYFEKVPSAAQKGAKLLSRKSLNLISILMLTSAPVKIEKMMEWMNYKKRQSFRELYLNPLQQVGFVKKTNMKKINDPEQQYVITEKGKAFLSGQSNQATNP
jgi:ATP-dependent DNA helicase RecG